MNSAPKNIGKTKKSSVLAIAAKDRRSYTANFKREPLKHTIKFWMIEGVPHKLENGVFVALKPKKS